MKDKVLYSNILSREMLILRRKATQNVFHLIMNPENGLKMGLISKLSQLLEKIKIPSESFVKVAI